MLRQHALAVWRNLDCVICGTANMFACHILHGRARLDVPNEPNLHASAPTAPIDFWESCKLLKPLQSTFDHCSVTQQVQIKPHLL